MSDLRTKTMASLRHEQPEPNEQFLFGPYDSRGSIGRIDLITKRLYDCLPKGTLLYDLKGDQFRKGTDYIDEDAPYGFLGYGFSSNRAVRETYYGPYRDH